VSVRELLPFRTQPSFEDTSLSGGCSAVDFSHQWTLSDGGESLPSQNPGYFGRSILRGPLSGESDLQSFQSQRESLPVNPSGLLRSTHLQEGLRRGKSSPWEFRRHGITSVRVILPLGGFSCWEPSLSRDFSLDGKSSFRESLPFRVSPMSEIPFRRWTVGGSPISRTFSSGNRFLSGPVRLMDFQPSVRIRRVSGLLLRPVE